jgi:NHLM bacteriocin system ABC transporter ATP-binding protein
MGFDIFKEQISKRKENDETSYRSALKELISILDEKHFSVETTREMKVALELILKSLRQPIPKIPENIEDAEGQMGYVLHTSGIMKRSVELTGDWWKKASGSFLGSRKDGKIVALLPAVFGGYEYRDPDNGRKIKVNRENSQTLNSSAFYFYRPFPSKKIGSKDLIAYILRSLNYADLFYVLLFSFIIALFGLFNPYMNQLIFDQLIPSAEKEGIFPVAVLLIGVLSGASFFGIIRTIMIARLRDKINLSVQSAVMMRIITLPISFFKDYSAGDLAARIGGINTLFISLSDTIITAGLTVLFSFVYIIQMYWFAPVLFLPGLISILSLLTLSVLTTIMQIPISRKQLQQSISLSGYTSAMFMGIQKIKTAGAEKRAFLKWASGYRKEGKLLFTPPVFLRIQPALALFVMMGGTLIMYYFSSINRIPQADYIAFVLAYGMVTGALMSLNSIASSLANIKPLMEMIRPILEAVPETSERKKIVTSLAGNIEMNHIVFRYEEDSPPILNNISLKIRSGEYVAIVGKTGSGKSTLLRLLLGFEKPETGAIYYDGQDLNTLDLRSTRQCIGVDLQNGKLFPGDIFSNIVLTAPWKTMEEAWEAARLAGIDEEIKAMPMGMHTVLSEGSGGISGGQKQRLLIARALISKPKILFFDEATSALDNLSQKRISESIAALKCTRLVIAHRLSTIRHCNRILVLEGGRIAEEGDYEELTERKGIFFRLIQRQTL